MLGYFSPAVKDNNWGSILQNLLLHQVRKYLLKLDPRKDHVKYWRPHIIFLVKNPRYECAILHFVNAMKKGGLYVLGHVKVSNFQDLKEEPANWHWLDLIDHLKIKAFAETTVASTYREGIQHLVRISGVGALKPNTVVLGFHEPNRPKRDYFRDLSSGFASTHMDDCFASSEMEASGDTLEFVGAIDDILKIGKNVCIYRNFEGLEHPNPRPNVSTWSWYQSVFQTICQAVCCSGSAPESEQFIDVWFINFFAEPNNILKDRRNLFMLQMAYIVSISHAWKSKLKLRVLYRVMRDRDEETRKRLRKTLKAILKEERIKAQVAEVPFDDVYELAKPAETPRNDVDDAADDHHDLDLTKIPMNFMQLSNSLLKESSSQSAVTFLHLPAPPKDLELQIQYIKLLTELTNGLPPTVMVHGIHAVTSTAL